MAASETSNILRLDSGYGKQLRYHTALLII